MQQGRAADAEADVTLLQVGAHGLVRLKAGAVAQADVKPPGSDTLQQMCAYVGKIIDDLAPREEFYHSERTVQPRKSAKFRLPLTPALQPLLLTPIDNGGFGRVIVGEDHAHNIFACKV